MVKPDNYLSNVEDDKKTSKMLKYLVSSTHYIITVNKNMQDYQHEFIQYAMDCDVLKFGEFKLKSGRISPYFFNSGLFNTGARLAKLGYFYSQALQSSNIEIDMLYGPAYKGIPLVSALSIAYSEQVRDIPYAFNRKETKDHGEGGLIVGTPLKGNILIVDDVITAGTSVSESIDIIKSVNATPAAVLIALDRQEIGHANNKSAVQDVMARFGLPVTSIITLDNIITFLENNNHSLELLKIIREYRLHYGNTGKQQ